jgi:phosphoribosyl-AMP cyclohydrolase
VSGPYGYCPSRRRHDHTAAKQPSDEIDENRLPMARTQGSSYHDAVGYVATTVASTGGTQSAGDYVVGFVQAEAEGTYELVEEVEFEWREPDGGNCHLEVTVMDADDGRFVSETTVRATMTDENGEDHGPFELPFLWHPGLYHYGSNVELPGTCDVHVEVESPTFVRHDETNGDRYGESVEVTFEGVEVETGQDRATEELWAFVTRLRYVRPSRVARRAARRPRRRRRELRPPDARSDPRERAGRGLRRGGVARRPQLVAAGRRETGVGREQVVERRRRPLAVRGAVRPASGARAPPLDDVHAPVARRRHRVDDAAPGRLLGGGEGVRPAVGVGARGRLTKRAIRRTRQSHRMNVELAFDGGLLPAVAQDAESGDVLMLAYVSPEAVVRTRETGLAHYYSRSREELWQKGATSGHVQHVEEVRVDCDGDAFLYLVDQEGGACHTGHESCFYRRIEGVEGDGATGSDGAAESAGGEDATAEGLTATVESNAERVFDPDAVYE